MVAAREREAVCHANRCILTGKLRRMASSGHQMARTCDLHGQLRRVILQMSRLGGGLFGRPVIRKDLGRFFNFSASFSSGFPSSVVTAPKTCCAAHVGESRAKIRGKRSFPFVLRNPMRCVGEPGWYWLRYRRARCSKGNCFPGLP